MKLRVLPAAVTLLFAAGCSEVLEDLKSPRPGGCFIGDADPALNLNAEQTYYAATISAVGWQMGMSEQAVTVALATAFQESQMANIEYGDRDSLGLFQQRPSQGWGTEEELLDPVYASYKFYEKLQRIDGWEEMRVTDAAQAVQISAFPEEYEKWADDAAAISKALAGGQEAGIACMADNTESASTSADGLATRYADEWGVEVDSVDGRTLRMTVDDSATGWNRANWAVAKSFEYAVASVEFDGMRWEAGEEAWSEAGTEAPETDAVLVTLFEAQPPESG